MLRAFVYGDGFYALPVSTQNCQTRCYSIPVPVFPVPVFRGLIPIVSDRFGPGETRVHPGADIMYPRAEAGALKLPHFARRFYMPDGIPALAFDDGVVTRAGVIDTGGRVQIDHGGGISTKYFHLRNLKMKVGDRVRAGDVVGTISHNPKGFRLNHLHFELLKNGRRIDPEPTIFKTGRMVPIPPLLSSGVKQGMVLGLLVAAGGVGVALLIRRGTRIADGQLGAAKHSLYAMPGLWWRKKPPKENKLCYRRKTDALNKFRDWNFDVIEEWGGITAKGSRGEFDALTKFEVSPTDIAEALWVSLPAVPRGRKYCLEDIDVEALNDTSPGKSHPVGFQLPDYVHEAKLIAEEQERYLLEPGNNGDVPF